MIDVSNWTNSVALTFRILLEMCEGQVPSGGNDVREACNSPKAPLHGPWSPADGVSFAANDLDTSMAVLSTAGPVKRGPITSVLHPLKTLESGVINVRAFD